ncbi:hypothetical protein RM545_17370 [Zunongwangia sp. F260]|uniref:Lipoprotein n=1 Tax=Autumnicola lenta TaxID=3075593 RepID=A0ABU3CQ60_9FLAO|nr:hypothetical protein [Zunongwangia sp. F260]MDT0648461.1 hypothetical protein [Zunongwangia sp. F260]
MKNYLLFIIALTFICCKNPTDSIGDKKTTIINKDTVQTDLKISKSGKKVERKDTKQSISANNLTDTTERATGILTGTNDNNLALKEFQITESSFNSILDSIVKREKRCMTSSLSNLHWTIFELQENVYHLTMASDIGKADFKGFFYVDGMLFLTSEKLAGFIKETGKTKEFTFEAKNMTDPEDYSAYFLANLEGKMNMVKSYPLPCEEEEKN